MTVKVEFTKKQADFIARMIANLIEQTEICKFDPNIRPVRNDAKTCLTILKSSGANDK